jgi:hypothetical protein
MRSIKKNYIETVCVCVFAYPHAQEGVCSELYAAKSTDRTNMH